MRRCRPLLIWLILAFGLSVGPASAQVPDTSADGRVAGVHGEGGGTAVMTSWPRSLPQLLRDMGRSAPYLLPRIDSLALEYRYASNDSTSRWSFVLGWKPNHRVLYEGEILPLEEAPSDIRMVNIELRADVLVDGTQVGEMIVGVDSMQLQPLPSIYSFEVTVGHQRLFLDASSEQARRALAAGITLDSLVVERMGFISASEPSPTSQRQRDVRKRRRSDPSIYEPRTQIFIGWRVGPRPYYVDEREGKRTVRPRGDEIGRGTGEAETRTRVARRGEDEDEKSGEDGGGKSRSSDEEEKDEEEPSLKGPALGAAAAIGLLAVAGGTVGLYGRGDTPIGLAAGYTQPTGGFQLHAAVNGAVIEDESGQKLTVKALGFYDVFSSRVQPAAGLGVQIAPRRARDVVPSVSLGAVGNLGRILLFGGFDVVQLTPEFGVTYNFRYRSSSTSKARYR